MWKFLRDYFSFSRTEQRVILLLSAVLLFALLIRLSTGYFSPQVDQLSEDEIHMVEEFIASLEIKDNKVQEIEKAREIISHKTEIRYDRLKVFDPNKISAGDLKEMGFPENVISNFSKYIQSGGRFSKPGEFRKIYGITDSAFRKIAPYIIIRDSARKVSIFSEGKIKHLKEPQLININSADSAQLVTLNGIGPGFALRIIKYRKSLGGFIKPEQLLEVYGMDSTRFDLFKRVIYIDTTKVTRIDLNKITFSELIKHPYMDKQSAGAIIKYREFKGRIGDVNELGSYNIITTASLSRIEPYLHVSNEE